jgi:hypothetical protein
MEREGLASVTDFRIIWFYDGKVTGIMSYKDHTPGTSASAHFKPIRWEDAPDRTIEIRQWGAASHAKGREGT